MATLSTVIDGKRHIIGEGFTRCGILLPYQVEWVEDPSDGKPDGKLCKTCYAAQAAADEQAAAVDAAHDADAADEPEPKADKNKASAKAK